MYHSRSAFFAASIFHASDGGSSSGESSKSDSKPAESKPAADAPKAEKKTVKVDDIDKRLDSVADLVALRDWLPSVGVDQSRIALYGGSYGGYMVLAGLAFYPELWAAGVDIVGVSSLVTFLQNTSAYRRAYREREYGRLAEDREMLEQASPFNAIDKIRAPLFVIHGANDPRVPLSEAEQVVAAVRASGADCPFLVYDDEGHGLAKRANQLDAYPQAFEFLAKHLAR